MLFQSSSEVCRLIGEVAPPEESRCSVAESCGSVCSVQPASLISLLGRRNHWCSGLFWSPTTEHPCPALCANHTGLWCSLSQSLFFSVHWASFEQKGCRALLKSLFSEIAWSHIESVLPLTLHHHHFKSWLESKPGGNVSKMDLKKIYRKKKITKKGF